MMVFRRFPKVRKCVPFHVKVKNELEARGYWVGVQEKALMPKLFGMSKTKIPIAVHMVSSKELFSQGDKADLMELWKRWAIQPGIAYPKYTYNSVRSDNVVIEWLDCSVSEMYDL